MEQGKDIITIGPDRRPCALQLKGNPGGRLTLQQYRAIEAQLLELVHLPIGHPSVPSVQHRAFLVTNGLLVEEEVILAIDKLNQGFKRDGFPNRQLEIIQRGDLVHWCQELGSSLWPSELEDVNLLLEMLVDQDVGLLPKQKLHRLLTHLLGLQEEQSLRFKAEGVRRRVTSSALLVAVALKNFSAKENHFAVISAWTMFCAYAIASCERYEVSFDKNARPAVALALSAIRDSLLALSDEVTNRPIPVEGNSIVDFVAYRARYTLLLSLFSVLWFWCEEAEWPSPKKKAEVESFLSSGIQQLYCWGEAAIPQILLYYWFLRENDGAANIEGLLVQLLQAITSEDEKGQMIGIPSPYFACEDVARHALAPILGQQQDPLRQESPGLISFYAEGLLHLLVRTGRKHTCKQLWPALTKVEWVFFAPASRWQYCLWRNKEGEYTEIQPPLTKHWNQLVEEARSVSCDIAPQPLVENRFLSALFLILFPYRANPRVVRKLGWQFDRTWFILPPLNDEVGKVQGRRSGNSRKNHAGLQRSRKLGRHRHRQHQQEGGSQRSQTR